MPSRLVPILPLIGSNLFMTIAWHGHLRFRDRPPWIVVLASWGIAFFDYGLAVPANRIGASSYSPAPLKAMQEIITLTVFAGFSALYLGQKLNGGQGAGFALIATRAFLIFRAQAAP